MADKHSDLGFQPAANPHSDLGFSPSTDQPAAAEPPGYLTQVGSGLWNAVKGLAQVGSEAGGVATEPWRAVEHLKNLKRLIVDPQVDQAIQAGERWKSGDRSEAVGHAIASILPGVGPMAARIGDKLGGGDVTGAAADATVLGATMVAPQIASAAGDLVPKLIPEGLPERMYQQALSPRANTPPAEVRGMVQTGLENKIPVSEAGTSKLHGLVQDLNRELEAKIQPAAEQGATIDPHKVVLRLSDVERRLANQVNPEKDLATVEASGDEFLRSQGASKGRPAVIGDPTAILKDLQGNLVADPGKPAVPATRAQPIPVDRAQAIKVGTYQKLAGKYGEQATDSAVESQKALARGIKEELDAAIPELKDLNAKEGSLFDLQGPLEAAVARAAKQHVMNKTLPVAVAGGAGEMIGGPAGAAAGAGLSILKEVLANPAVRSRLAIAINQAKRANPGKWGAESLPSATSRARIATESLLRSAMGSGSEDQE